MKLRSLELRAFGSLRDVRLDFTDDAPRLHVIYGPNEAGKSTALRALRGLFFGIASNTRDAHSIKPADLRVAALLSDSEGRQRYVVRRKGLKDTLRAEDDKTPLSAEEVLWVTAGMHASTFESQFGLTFDTLHRGADELLGSGGDLGQSLFAAAVNGGQVRRVLEGLEAEAEALFRKKGVKMPLNVAIAQFEQAKRESREHATRADVFEQQQSEVEAAQAAYAELTRQLSALRAERAKLERVKNILPLLSRQRARQAERAALGTVARLSGEAADERRRALAQRRDAQVRLEQTQAELERLAQNRQALEQHIAPALVTMTSSSAEQLRDRLSLYRDAQRKLPSRKEALKRARREVERARLALQLKDADAA
ncbi:MAG TPA: AAA family ATPase, partial [Polyangiales bacterium]|nr:AAA family ATPase [Polyangiales bacterium]